MVPHADAQSFQFPTPHSIDPIVDPSVFRLGNVRFTAEELELALRDVEGSVELADPARAPYHHIGGPFGGLLYDSAYLDPDVENDWNGVAPFTAKGYLKFTR